MDLYWTDTIFIKVPETHYLDDCAPGLDWGSGLPPCVWGALWLLIIETVWTLSNTSSSNQNPNVLQCADYRWRQREETWSQTKLQWPDSARSEKGQLFPALHDGCTGKRKKIEASCRFRLEIIHLTLCNFHSFEASLLKVEWKLKVNINTIHPQVSSLQTTNNALVPITGDPGLGAEPPH